MSLTVKELIERLKEMPQDAALVMVVSSGLHEENIFNVYYNVQGHEVQLVDESSW